MPHIPNLRSYAKTTPHGIPKLIIRPGGVSASAQNDPEPAKPQGYLDTPDVIYSEWNINAGGIDKPLGTLTKDFKVCLIGGGITNVVAAFELVKAGADVTLLEATDKVGGRCRSIGTADGNDIAEMGAMRFPPSEDLLYYYAEQTGFTFLPNFPDPGVVPTIIWYKDNAIPYDDTSKPPAGFENVCAGWGAFLKSGITNGGNLVLASPYEMQEKLQMDSQGDRRQVIPAWQKYLDTFKNNSFFDGLQRIFGPAHEWDVPNGIVWTDDDFDRFGALGLGSGGFGPLFEISFNTVFRLIPNGLEAHQQSFARQQGTGSPIPAGIQDLAEVILEKAIALGLQFKPNTTGDVGGLNQSTPASMRATEATSMAIDVKEVGPLGTSVTNTYTSVIVGVTTHAMNINMSLTSKSLFSPEVSKAINNVHMTSSSKLFVRTKKFWENKDPLFPRVVLSDTKLPQLYTLDYGDPDYGMVLVTYAWEDQSIDIEAVSDPAKLFETLKAQLADIMKQTNYPNWADNVVPVTPDDYYMIHWQLDPNMNGAFMLSYPGQDPETASMFYDFTKINNTGMRNTLLQSPTLLNGDSIGFTGGWIDGGLQCAMNILSAIFKEYGTVNADEFAPINLINANNYTYTE